MRRRREEGMVNALLDWVVKQRRNAVENFMIVAAVVVVDVM